MAATRDLHGRPYCQFCSAQGNKGIGVEQKLMKSHVKTFHPEEYEKQYGEQEKEIQGY